MQMGWSNNVTEERDCLHQILIGSMNEKVCVVLGLALFLEKWIADGVGGTSQWLFLDGVTDSRSTLQR